MDGDLEESLRVGVESVSTVVVSATCVCGSLSPTVQLCPDHHRYFRAGKELASVTRVLKSTWPIPADYSKADPDVLDHARRRGILVDHLFSAHVMGQPVYIPRGTGKDVIDEGKELYQKFVEWWQPRPTMSQVVLADDAVAGTCDVFYHMEAGIWDVKATHSIEATYAIQLGFYGILHEAQFGKPPRELGIIHVTKRYAKPQVIPLDVEECMNDAWTIRRMWNLVQRRTA